VPLNATGIHQANDAKARLADLSITTICCSPLGRARQTAEIANEDLKYPIFAIDGLQECGFGELEGKLITMVSYSDLVRSAGPSGGEPFEAFVERVITGLNQALAQPGPVLVVSHSGVFNALQFHVSLDHDGDITNSIPVRLKPILDTGNNWKMIQV